MEGSARIRTKLARVGMVRGLAFLSFPEEVR